MWTAVEMQAMWAQHQSPIRALNTYAHLQRAGAALLPLLLSINRSRPAWT